MDQLGVLNHLSGVMTVDEWGDFKQTDDYLWMMAKIEGYRGKTMAKLVAAGQRRRSEAWVIAQEMATNIITKEIEELPLEINNEQVQALIVGLAEKLLCEQNISPPTFVNWADCQTCGRVPVPKGVEAVTPNCPWCNLC